MSTVSLFIEIYLKRLAKNIRFTERNRNGQYQLFQPRLIGGNISEFRNYFRSTRNLILDNWNYSGLEFDKTGNLD